jgi:hypothetical protein
MAERWVPQVVSQTGCCDNLSVFLKERILQFRMPLDELLRYIITQRHTHTCHLQRVGQTVVYEDAARKWEYLRLVLQTTERGRKDQTVVVAFELRAVIMALRVAMFLPKALVGYQLLPIHHIQDAKVMNFG